MHKLVDYYLVTRDTLKELSSNIQKELDKCKDLGLTISRKKFVIGTKINFTRFELLQQGVQPDKAKTKAISEFPTPKDITTMRSFLGLANQIAHFIPDLATILDPIRQLLKKNTTFVWLREHNNTFSKMKEILTSNISLQHFDPCKPPYLIADASKLNGLSFLLIQSGVGPDHPKAVIQCGSQLLSKHEKKLCNH